MAEGITSEILEQSSALNDELVSAEMESEIDDQAYYAMITINDLFSDKSNAHERDNKKRIYYTRDFKPPVDGRDFLQAGVPHEGKDMYSIGELGYDRQNYITMYDLGRREVIRVPQCHMLQVPKKKNPYLYLTMSTCSAIIGQTGEDLFIAHVGLSERGGLQKFVEYMKQQGVSSERMYAVASLCEVPEEFKGVKTDRFDFSRVETIEDLTQYGIKPENIRSFDYLSGGATASTSIAGVVATSRYVGSYLFDYKRENGRDICGPMRDVHVIKC